MSYSMYFTKTNLQKLKLIDFQVLYHYKTLSGRVSYYPHFPGEETKTERGQDHTAGKHWSQSE